MQAAMLLIHGHLATRVRFLVFGVADARAGRHFPNPCAVSYNPNLGFLGWCQKLDDSNFNWDLVQHLCQGIVTRASVYVARLAQSDRASDS
jgi:hypothetical protein